jgi:hypothetical protein
VRRIVRWSAERHIREHQPVAFDDHAALDRDQSAEHRRCIRERMELPTFFARSRAGGKSARSEASKSQPAKSQSRMRGFTQVIRGRPEAIIARASGGIDAKEGEERRQSRSGEPLLAVGWRPLLGSVVRRRPRASAGDHLCSFRCTQRSTTVASGGNPRVASCRYTWRLW